MDSFARPAPLRQVQQQVTVAVALLEAHRSKSSVQATGLRALAALLAQPAGAEVLLRVRGLEAVVGAMTEHKGDSLVQLLGLRALERMADTVRESQTNTTRIFR
jgi:hypothetical protein